MNNLIKKYIENLKKENIIAYAKKENIHITEDEINIIFNSIKNNTDTLLSKNAIDYIQKLKPLLSEEVYNKIIEKYQKYKDFIF